MTLLDDIGTETKAILRGEFSEPVAILFEGTGGDTTISTRGILDKAYERFIVEDGSEIANQRTSIEIWETDLALIYGPIGENEDLNWRAVIRSEEYRIYDVERDGTGLVTLRLRLLDT